MLNINILLLGALAVKSSAFHLFTAIDENYPNSYQGRSLVFPSSNEDYKEDPISQTTNNQENNEMTSYSVPSSSGDENDYGQTGSNDVQDYNSYSQALHSATGEDERNYDDQEISPTNSVQEYSIIHSSNVGAGNSGNYNGVTGYAESTVDHYADIYKSPITVHTKENAQTISQHIEVERPIAVPYIKKIHVPIPKGVKVNIPHPVLVPVPEPYAVHIPVSHPVAVPMYRELTIPIEKLVPYPVEKKVPVPIERPVPYPIEKHIPVQIPQPYPVRVPVYKTIYHKQKLVTNSGPAPPAKWY